ERFPICAAQRRRARHHGVRQLDQRSSGRIQAGGRLMYERLGKALVWAGDWLVGLSIWDSRTFRALALIVALAFFASVIVTPLSLGLQALFGLITFATAYVLNRVSRARLTVLVLMAISSVATLRYMYWRLTETLGFEHLF